MRRLVYSVAASLDGFIAGPTGDYDWIVHDPAIDFAAIFARYDTLLMGRKTFEVAQSRRSLYAGLDHQWVVVSRTLKREDFSDTTILSSDISKSIATMKAQPGKDIWLFGGGELFRSLLDAGLVDKVEIELIPVMLGSGVPLLNPGQRRSLHLDESQALPSGIVSLKYSVLS